MYPAQNLEWVKYERPKVKILDTTLTVKFEHLGKQKYHWNLTLVVVGAIIGRFQSSDVIIGHFHSSDVIVDHFQDSDVIIGLFPRVNDPRRPTVFTLSTITVFIIQSLLFFQMPAWLRGHLHPDWVPRPGSVGGTVTGAVLRTRIGWRTGSSRLD